MDIIHIYNYYVDSVTPANQPYNSETSEEQSELSSGEEMTISALQGYFNHGVVISQLHLFIIPS